MRPFVRFGLTVALVALATTAAACTRKSESPGGDAAKTLTADKVKVALVPGGAHPYFQPWRDTGAKAKGDFGIGDVSYNETAGWEQTKQNDVLTSMAARGYNAFGIFGVAPENINATFENLKRLGFRVGSLASCPAGNTNSADFCLSDALTPAEALDMLKAAVPGRAERTEHLLAYGYPAYTTSAGWLGYDDDKLVRLAKEAVADGYRQIKLKVGADLEDDVRRFALARQAVGPSVRIAADANQRWDPAEAVAWMTALAPYDPWWIEEPTSPDDVLGHADIRQALSAAGPGGGPIRVATGEHVANRVMFKQLLRAEAIDFVQLDACRVGGVNENVAILLLAAKFGRPVCPHAGGVGLCELVQHLSMFDYVAVSGSMDERVIEYVDHLHEHFTDPVVIERGAYRAPRAPGFSARMKPESLAAYAFPSGAAWQR